MKPEVIVYCLEWNCNKLATKTEGVSWKCTHFLLKLPFLFHFEDLTL